MRVICCTAGEVHPAARVALDRFAPGWELVETPGRFGYSEALAARWTGADDLVVVEGDKEISAETLPGFAACDRPWCVCTYDIFPPPWTREAVTGLGCARFTAAVQRLVPASLFLGADPEWCWCPDCRGRAPGCWRNLDARVAFALMGAGVLPCQHGRVAHHHDYPPGWTPYTGAAV